jgi:hypothetical protein
MYLFIYGLSTMFVAQTMQCLGLTKLYQFRYNTKKLISDICVSYFIILLNPHGHL